jgi:DNA polymerase III subunit epsilon
MIRHFLTRPLVFFDLETTGVDVAKARIIELYFHKIHPTDPKLDEHFYSLINPCCPIPEEITKITKIDNDRVKDEPVFFSIAPSLRDFIQGCDLGGYNIIRYDIPVLFEEFLRANIEQPFAHDANFVDPLLIFRKMFPHTLKNAYKYFVGDAWDDEEAHGASYDVSRTIDVLDSQLQKYEGDIPDKTPAGIQKFTVDKGTVVDFAGKLCLDANGKVVFDFGVHKGKCVTDVPATYIDWILKTEFPLHTKLKIKECLALLSDSK